MLANPGSRDDGQVDPALVGLIVRAHAARKVIAQHPHQSLAEIAAGQGLTTKYFTLLIRLSTLGWWAAAQPTCNRRKWRG